MRVLFVTIFVLATLLVLAAPAEAQFQDDPGDTCLCPNDPFCACTGGGTGTGGGSGSTPSGSCKKCVLKITVYPDGTVVEQQLCKSATTQGNYKDECHIQPDGSCELFGNSCSIYVV
jgi:hypothetical protein